jgi:hypothetical protein
VSSVALSSPGWCRRCRSHRMLERQGLGSSALNPERSGSRRTPCAR